MKADITKFIRECPICQREKYETLKSPGHLCPLPIPTHLWTDISMDFIEALPRSEGHEVIMVVVDRLSKYIHLAPLPRTYTAPVVARAYQDYVGKLHGMPRTIISDRDSIFLSQFWKEYMKMAGVQLLYSSAHHPQTDGQTEVVNRTIEIYLRSFAGERPSTWTKYLSWCEWAYNTSIHGSTKMSPFEVVYGQPPPTISTYEPFTIEDTEVERQLVDRDEVLRNLQDNLLKAQNRMKQQHDKGRKEREFEEGSWVWLKRLMRGQRTMFNKPYSKLLPRYYGPYKVLRRHGKAAYKLELPEQAKVHPVFHVSRLKPFHGDRPDEITIIEEETTTPKQILRRRKVKHNGDTRIEYLVEWEGREGGPTWEDSQQFWRTYPQLRAWRQALSQRGGLDTAPTMAGIQPAPITAIGSPEPAKEPPNANTLGPATSSHQPADKAEQGRAPRPPVPPTAGHEEEDPLAQDKQRISRRMAALEASWSRPKDSKQPALEEGSLKDQTGKKIKKDVSPKDTCDL
jgi:hypothetical protein